MDYNPKIREPKLVLERSAWCADTILSEPELYYRLNDHEIDELLQALQCFKSQKLELSELSQKTFKLNTLSKTLKKISQTLTQDIGVKIIQNFPMNNFSSADINTLYSGLGCYIGQLLPQNDKKNYLFEIKDEASLTEKYHGRLSTTNQALAFHSDSCDITSLLCVNPAKKGGSTQLVNTLAVHNEMLLQDPELLKLLYGDFYYTLEEWSSDNLEPPLSQLSTIFKLPIFSYYQHRLICFVRRKRINLAQGLQGVPQLTQQQIAALDMMDHFFCNKKLILSLDLKRGEILLFNNLMTCHGRTSFIDDADPSLKRSLIRLWIAPPASCALPPGFFSIFHATKAGALRGFYT